MGVQKLTEKERVRLAARPTVRGCSWERGAGPHAEREWIGNAGGLARHGRAAVAWFGGGWRCACGVRCVAARWLSQHGVAFPVAHMRPSPPHRTLHGLLCGRLLCCVQDKDGWSAIMVAAGKGNTEAIKALIAGKADLNLQVQRW